MLQLLSDVNNPTPLVELKRVSKDFKHAKFYGKLEWYNPFGSIKDRMAANMIASAQEKGEVGSPMKGSAQNLVEPTSGNTGFGLTMVAQHAGIPVSIPISVKVPEEKRSVLKFLGANVIEVDDGPKPDPLKKDGAIQLAEQMGSKPETLMLNQY